MKRLWRLLPVFALLLTCLGWGNAPQAQAADLTALLWQSSPVVVAQAPLRNEADDKRAETKDKIDLNNTNLRAFRKYQGYFPYLASKIINNAPYDEVDDVLKIPGLSETQKTNLKKHLDDFTVTPVSEALTQGGDRLNNGIYD